MSSSELAAAAASNTGSGGAAIGSLAALPFKYIVAVDFEFEFGGHPTPEAASRSGERPRPVCMVATELRSGRTWRLRRGEFGAKPPFPTGADAVLVAYYASAELGCFKALNWKPPVNLLDLFTEFRNRTNGRWLPYGAGLLGAAAYFGISAINIVEKRETIELILSGGPWSDSQWLTILSYCESDVLALGQLLPVMLPQIDLPRALLRGRFMKAAAAIEWNGVPIDVVTLGLLRHYWTAGFDPRRSLPERRQGTHNKITVALKKGIMTAAKRHGRDGEGTGGVDGYLQFLAARHPKIFAGLLGRLLPSHVKIDDASGPAGLHVSTVNIVGVPSGTFLSREEISEIERRERERDMPPLIEHEVTAPPMLRVCDEADQDH